MTEQTKPVAVLCGSVTRAAAALDAAEAWYQAQGYTVYKPVRNDAVSREQHAEWQYGRISHCDPERDVVVACTMQHTDLGTATKREIGDALHLGKRVRLWVEPAPPGRVTCPWCQRDGRKLTQYGRIRHHLNPTGGNGWPTCEGTGKRPDEYYAERAS